MAQANPTSEPPAAAKRYLRPHLLTLAAYTPIEPFEILSAYVHNTLSLKSSPLRCTIHPHQASPPTRVLSPSPPPPTTQ